MDRSSAAAHAAAAAHAGAVPEQKLVRRGHQLELLQQAKHLCDGQDYVDLTIYCEDGVVRAHQMLLATASPFLKLLFQTSPLYGVDDISIILPEVKACLVQALVHFVYTGTVVSKEDHFYSLMKLVYALNINASIEAESTNEKPTAFGAPLLPPEPSVARRKLSVAAPQPQPQLAAAHHPPQPMLSGQPLGLPQIPTLPTQPVVSLPTHPVPAAKMPRLATSMALPTISTGATAAAGKMSIQLPTQPVPLAGMVNGGGLQPKAEALPQTGSYIAVDPNTGLSYKVEMSNGPVASADASDPLAAIMNETIFTDTSGAVYTSNENGQVVYQGPAGVATSVATVVAATQQQQQPPQPQPPPPPPPPQSATPSKGKKRKAGNKENQILTESVDDLPCTPDDEDINTPYPCEHCNKTIKGRVMLQAHHYQEHYDNPELNGMALGDKHACRVCLKLFTRNSDVKAHILRVHCGDRRYPCTMCGKRFKESTHLRKHLYTHTGERPHYCTLCNKGFQTSSDLKRHKRTRVHQERVEQSNSGEGGADDSLEDRDDEEPGEAEGSGDRGDGAAGGYSHWTDDEASSAQANQQQQPPVTATKSLADNTAQVLLNNITEPLASSSSTTSAFTTSSSSTIDMKALGGATAWNNNQGQSVSTASASSTLDLKALTATASTVDMNALKWQQQQQQGGAAVAGGDLKRSSSVDSPGQDEERLTVVEGDDTSQDSVVSKQQQMEAAAAASNSNS